MDKTAAKLKQHEQQIARLTSSLERIKASGTLENLQSEIEGLLAELSSELQQAERTILHLNPIKARLVLTSEARELSTVRRARGKILRMRDDFRKLSLD